MKKIILILTTTLLATLLLTYIGLNRLEGQEHYDKLFSGKHHSMIIGTSKAAKLDPNLISDQLDDENKFDDSLYNFAFNLGMSPFGEAYNQQIFKHLDESSTKEGLFIICVDPWALSVPIKSPRDLKLPEEKTSINFSSDVKNANAKYFFENFPGSFYTVLLPDEKSKIEESSPDAEFIEKHRAAKIRSYRRKHFLTEMISKDRINSLFELIRKLQEHGKVYVVRLPVDSKMVELEAEYCPEFDEFLKKESLDIGIDLIDFYPYVDSFICPDGNHLWDGDAKKVSKILGDLIRLNEEGDLGSNQTDLLDKYFLHAKAKYKLNDLISN